MIAVHSRMQIDVKEPTEQQHTKVPLIVYQVSTAVCPLFCNFYT